MNQTAQPEAPGPGGLESTLRRHVDQLTYLPASVSVAVKFIELGTDLDAGPVEYEKTISSDPALGTKILALANSSWYGVRNEVTTVLQAVTLLGLANIRTLAIGYCMAGLHNHLRIPKENAKQYWQASLCKGVAAKCIAHAMDARRADEAFLCGLFQDIALPLVHSVAPGSLSSILQDPACSVDYQLGREREAFGVDHVEVGRWIGAKLELPEAYVDAIGFHHDPGCIAKFVESDAVATAIQVASLFPHVPDRWSTTDVKKLSEFLRESGPGEFKDHEKFLVTVQTEFDTLYGYFEPGQSPELRLPDLMADVCEEIADSTMRMHLQVRELMDEAAKTGRLVQNLVTEHERVVDESRIDALTGVLTRAGFLTEADRIVHSAGRRAIPFAVLYCDIDDFKEVNDTHGHHFGDFVLRELCSRISERVRKTDVFGRLGGDEFVLVLSDIEKARVCAVVDAIMRSVRDEPFVKGKVAVKKTVSVGALYMPGSRTAYDITALLKQADMLMYEAKRSGPGKMCVGLWRAMTAVEPA
ncbi:MAG: GGDEF domain-containing protein [Phycisphaerales bacterium]|nr:MAG: GGDEF domain-containing protein [Phycisphaerales bacterium]